MMGTHEHDSATMLCRQDTTMSVTTPGQEATRGPAKGAPRRGFGRIRRERSGRYSAAYVGPDLQLHRATVTFEARLDAEGWLHAEHRRI